MSLQQRTRNLNIADQENLTKRQGKQIVSKPTVIRRPALGELGNKIHTFNNVKQKQTEIKPTVLKKTTAKEALPRVPIIQTKQQVTKVVPAPISVATKQTGSIANDKKGETKPFKLLKNETSKTTTLIIKKDLLASKKEINVKNDDNKTEEEIGYSSKQLEGVIDVDANDKSDHFLVSEYIEDICAYLHSLEIKYKIKENYLENHRSNASMRSILINWMVDVNTNFKFVLETLHLSVAILDRYLQVNTKVGRETLQLVGSAAMIIASKYEEIQMPEVSDFVYLCDNTYSQTQMLQMESDILCKLKFNLGRPLSIHFLRRYSKVAAVRPEHHNLSKYLIEICLIEYKLCHINPSLQAAAALCLSMCILDEVPNPKEVWSKTLVHYTNYKYSELEPTLKKLAFFILKTEKSKLKAIPKKYSNVKYGKVSIIPQLNGDIVIKLAEEGQAYLK